jgi:hypothetical protein
MDYKQGPNPAPGGEVDIEADRLPPYDGRTDVRGENKHGGEDSVARQLPDADHSSEGQTASPAEESPAQESELAEGEPETALGVGESVGRRGEDIKDDDGKERGRQEGPREHESGRPTGYSDGDDSTSI